MRWKLKPFSASRAAELSTELGLYSIVAGVLVARDLGSPSEARQFMHPSLDADWSNPEGIPGMSEIASCLEAAVRNNKRICIFGDYDVDGITASAILYNTLAEVGAKAQVILPLREGEGYGLTPPALERVYALEPEVLVTVDCGVSGAEEVQQLLEHGIEVLITDHHEGSGGIPQGVPVADPKLDPSNPASILAGAGVALKLAALLGARFNKPNLWKAQLDLATLGTVADCMPLVGENRSLVATGVQAMNTQPRASIAGALEVSGRANDAITTESLSFGLIPRLNAAGRISDPMISFDLLTARTPERAQTLALKLEKLNTERKQLEAIVLSQAEEQVAAFVPQRRSVVVGKSGWNRGITGIVAGRLARNHEVPAIVFSYEDGLAIGSGRSVGSLDLHSAVGKLSDMLLKFGGHQAAIGLTIEEERVAEFAERLETILQPYDADIFEFYESIDCLVSLEQLSLESVSELDVLAPFGRENPQPCFLTTNLLIKSPRYVGQGQQHLSFTLSDGARELAGIWFNTKYRSLDELPLQADVVYRVEVEEWKGRRKLKLHVLDMFASSEREASVSSTVSAQGQDALEHLLFSSNQERLNQHIAQVLYGDELTLRAAQDTCLQTLQQGKSTLGIMATGRGKSLIFHTHAAKLALKEQAPSLFIYPLRSLIGDQEYALSTSLRALGISCASLTGVASEAERQRIATGIAKGEIHILLSTPEFVLANAQTLPFWHAFKFVVVDEAHHIATSSKGFRPDYTRLERLRQLIPDAVLLGLSATSDKPTTDAIVASLGIENIVVDTSKRPNLRLVDKRNHESRTAEVVQIVSGSPKTLVYTSSRVASIELCKEIRKQLRPKAHRIAFYNAALTTKDRCNVERAFRANELDCVIATSAFGEGINIPDVRDVVLYDMPYSIIDFNQMAGRAGRDGKEAVIHVLAGRTDADSLLEHQRSLGEKQGDSRDGSAAHLEQTTSIVQMELFADWLFNTSSHGLSSVIQRPLTPLGQPETECLHT